MYTICRLRRANFKSASLGGKCKHFYIRGGEFHAKLSANIVPLHAVLENDWSNSTQAFCFYIWKFTACITVQRNSPHKLNISHSLKDLPPKVIFNPLIFLCCCKCAQYLHNIYYWLCLESNNVLFLSSLHSCLVSFKLILILGIIHKGR